MVTMKAYSVATTSQSQSQSQITLFHHYNGYYKDNIFKTIKYTDTMEHCNVKIYTYVR